MVRTTVEQKQLRGGVGLRQDYVISTRVPMCTLCVLRPYSRVREKTGNPSRYFEYSQASLGVQRLVTWGFPALQGVCVFSGQ